jgi:PIN domain nuclease of toxin-antitoxin system
MYLLDTHLVLWAALDPLRLSPKAQRLLRSRDNELAFSLATLWEVAIKTSLGRPDFQVDPAGLHESLLNHGFHAVPLLAQHLFAVSALPWHHRDPFDRLLVAQAECEKMTLLTSDKALVRYGKFVQAV